MGLMYEWEFVVVIVMDKFVRAWTWTFYTFIHRWIKIHWKKEKGLNTSKLLYCLKVFICLHVCVYVCVLVTCTEKVTSCCGLCTRCICKSMKQTLASMEMRKKKKKKEKDGPHKRTYIKEFNLFFIYFFFFLFILSAFFFFFHEIIHRPFSWGWKSCW